MNCLFIYNPRSGRGKVLKYLDYIKNELNKAFDSVTVMASNSATHLKELVSLNGSLYDCLVFSGGDGTFNVVVMGVSNLEKRPILGYIPTGTANDIARNLKISRRVKKAIKVIKQGYIIKHDVGKINDHYFVYVVGIGACTKTSYTTKQDTKKILGRLAYAKDGLNEFFHNEVIEATIKNKDEEFRVTTPLLLILNTISVGGIPFNRYGHLNNGTFDVAIIKNGKGKGRWNIIAFFLRGILGFKRRKFAHFFKASEFEVIVNDDITWCIDGEEGVKGSVKILNLHNHIQIYAPLSKIRRLKWIKKNGS